MASKEVATTGGVITNYPALNPEASADFLEVMAENFGENGGMQASDLDTIIIPAGGGSHWMIPSLDGDEPEKVLEGIIVAWAPSRRYWEKGLDDKDTEKGPPQCSSDDGMHGNGEFGPRSALNPTGECESCPMNQFGTLDGKDGKACKEYRMLFMLRPETVLPVQVQLPVTSIPAIRKYFLRLSSNALPYYGLVTRLGLEQIKSAFDYSRVVPEAGDRLSKEERAAAKAYGATIKAAMAKRSTAAVQPDVPATPEAEAAMTDADVAAEAASVS
jgi:hypothetical protein